MRDIRSLIVAPFAFAGLLLIVLFLIAPGTVLGFILVVGAIILYSRQAGHPWLPGYAYAFGVVASFVLVTYFFEPGGVTTEAVFFGFLTSFAWPVLVAFAAMFDSPSEMWTTYAMAIATLVLGYGASTIHNRRFKS